MAQIRENREPEIDLAYQLTAEDHAAANLEVANLEAANLEAAKNGTHPGVVVLMTLGLLVAVGIFVAGVVAFGPVAMVSLSDLAARVGLQWPNSSTLGTGDVQVTLRWEGEADLDLRVVDPTGGEVSYETPLSASGGIFNADANGACEAVKSPVENIYWPVGVAPNGSYEVIVVYYQPCSSSADPVAYEVTITLDGEVANVMQGEAGVIGERVSVITFEY